MKPTAKPDQAERDRWLNLVHAQVESLRFGVVQIVVHDSRVVQIDRTERLRFDKTGQVTSTVPRESVDRLGLMTSEAE